MISAEFFIFEGIDPDEVMKAAYRDSDMGRRVVVHHHPRGDGCEMRCRTIEPKKAKVLTGGEP